MKKLLLTFITLQTALFLNGAEKEKFFAYRSFQPETAAMRAFGEQGINLYAVMPSNSYNSLGEPYCMFKPFWVWDETYLWNVVDEQFDLVIRQNPKAKFICMVDINSPMWLARRLNRIYGMGGDSYHDVSNSYCIPEWRTLTGKMLKEFVKHMEERYGDRVFAYMVAGGGTSEWYCNSKGRAVVPKEKEWAKWLKKNGLPNWKVPRHEEVYTPSFEKFFDPQTQKPRIEYVRFTEYIISEAMDHFSKIVREVVGDKKQVGAFCGFIPAATCGKMDNRMTFRSPHNDFSGDPGQYENRAIGNGGGMNAAVKSLQLYGKHWFQEIDQRTHTYNHDLTPYVKIRPDIAGVPPCKNQPETTAVLKREFSLATIMQNSLWCFDMWGGVFSTPETMELVGKAHKIWQKYKDSNLPMRAEILNIIDPDSGMYTNFLAVAEIKRALFACGAPIDQVFIDDIDKIDLSKYKMVVMAHSYEITPEKKKLLDKYIFNNNRTVITMHAFGITDGKTLNKDFTKQLTGFEYRQKGINQKQMDGWKSVYAGETRFLKREKIFELAKQAGVHLYTDEPTPVYANEKLVAVHTKKGGKKTVFLPRKVKQVKELFTDKIVAENTDKFDYNFISPDTALFELID